MVRHDDPMHKSSSPRFRFRLYTALSGLVASAGAAAALFAGVTPATAANLASQPDTQIAVFMVPLTMLMVAILIEVSRFALRGPLPAEVIRQSSRRPLSPLES